MADEKPAPDAEEKSSAGKKGLLENKVLVLGIVVILQVILAVGLTQFIIVPKLSVQNASLAEGGNSEGQPDLGVIVGLEEIIVSLQGEGEKGLPHYLRINVNLEVDTQSTADLVVARLPQLRDIVIMTLSQKQAAELSTAEGTQAVRNELFRGLAEKLPQGSLRSIYFSDLVIQ
jgi:flagellar FliL protein